MEQVKEWLGATWLPCVMVLASPDADRACVEGTGLHFAELLRPFGVLRELNGGVGGERASRGACRRTGQGTTRTRPARLS